MLQGEATIYPVRIVPLKFYSQTLRGFEITALQPWDAYFAISHDISFFDMEISMREQVTLIGSTLTMMLESQDYFDVFYPSDGWTASDAYTFGENPVTGETAVQEDSPDPYWSIDFMDLIFDADTNWSSWYGKDVEYWGKWLLGNY